MKEARYKIDGHFWKLRFAEIPDDRWGDTDYRIREIRFHPSIVDRPIQEQLDTLIHEVRHAQEPRMNEDIQRARGIRTGTYTV